MNVVTVGRPVRRLLAGLALATAALASGVFGLGAAVATADTPTQRAVTALRQGPGVYADPAAIGQPLSRADVRRIRTAVQTAASPFYVAVLGEQNHGQAQSDLRDLVDGVGVDGTYAVVGTGGFV